MLEDRPGAMQGPALHRIVGMLLLALAVPLLAWQSTPSHQLPIPHADFLALHSLLEIFAVAVAALVFFVGMGTTGAERSTRAMLLGGAFLAVALFDAQHLLSYAGMPDVVSANSPHKSILFWLLSRYAAGIGLLGYLLLAERPLPVSRLRRQGWYAGILLLVLCASWFPLTAPERLAPMYREGIGLTPLKIRLEWGACALYLGGALLLVLRRRRQVDIDFNSLLLALLLLAASELFFILYVRVASTANLLGHAYKLVAYYFLYRAIYAEAIRRPFRRMRDMLTHDVLTGLPNRVGLAEHLEQVLARREAANGDCALLLLGLDHFRHVNDTLGYAQGDRLLVAVASRIRASVPKGVFVARLSGDEFVVVLEGQPPAAARELGELLLQAMTREFGIGQDRIQISASIGLMASAEPGQAAGAVMRHAGLALHRAKQSGRNCMEVYDRSVGAEFDRQMLLESQLRVALERGELLLHYQPQWNVRSGALVGWEALLRWHSAELGKVAPGEFVPVAERSGLILAIGNWVLREACRQLRAWRDAGLAPGTMAVNLSARQFRQRDLVDMVGQVLRENDLPPSSLELEITESMLMDDLAAAAAVLGDLQKLGVNIAIDDFGTGYSSLGYLKAFPLHCLKIDRSFIADVPGDASDAAIVRTIIALADNLGLRVLAEGVETQAQLAFLREHHCAHMQGYLKAPPLPAEQCLVLLQAQREEVVPAP
ncbi:EAL domain-containing protein [Thermomonas sp. XSG]|uniref:putative bifunctional diguanylate cyclase/phosphodiesterase n=1 Tax=Thermomonas sp. XSG TaxID=2771436 RepID=UPI001CC1C2BD|nr:EAL domain-containing protein [Thermomonas sp. XSG]